MRINEELYDLAERYLSGELSEEEKVYCENLLLQSDEFKQHVQLIQKANTLIKAEGLATDWETIKVAEGNYLRRIVYRRIASVAAIFIIISICYLYFYPKASTKQDQKLPEVETPQIIKGHEVISEISDETKKVEIKKSNETVLSNSNSVPQVSADLPTQIKTPELKPNDSRTNFSSTTDSVKEVKPIASCADPPKIEWQINATCIGKNDGKISITTIQGANPPFLFSLDQKNFTDSKIFYFLSEDDYTLWIKDSKGCVYQKGPIRIEEKNCEEKNNHFLFSYSKSDPWKFPVFNDSEQEITIFNNSGNVVYSAEIKLGNPEFWFGLDNNGNKLSSGIYPFKIIADGQLKLSGTITIVE